VCAEPPRVDAEDLVTDPELGDGRADCFDLTGQLGAEDLPLRPQETGDQAADEGLAAAKSAVGPGDRRGADLDEDLVLVRDGPHDIFESQDVRRTITVADNCSHGLTLPLLGLPAPHPCALAAA
jgi:hypothetical protein